MGNFYIEKSDIHKYGLFSAFDVPTNTKLFVVADLERYNKREDWISKMGKLINHQKKSNIILKKHGSKFYAHSIVDIKAGDEITADYTLAPRPFSNNVKGYRELK